MKGVARVGDLVSGGKHCHGGHSHPPPETPGLIKTGSSKVLVDGRPVATEGDEGYSPLCCGGIGKIVLLKSQSKVLVEGKPIAFVDTPSAHCGAPGKIKTGSRKVFIKA